MHHQVSRLEVENNELSRKLEKLRNSMDEQARLHNSQVFHTRITMMEDMMNKNHENHDNIEKRHG